MSLRAATEAPPPLTSRFLAAVALASEIHDGQRRMGTEIPYMAHLLIVTGLVLEDGGDETGAIAARMRGYVPQGQTLRSVSSSSSVIARPAALASSTSATAATVWPGWQ